MSCCAPPIFGLSPLDNFGVIGPDMLNIYVDYCQFCGTPILKPMQPMAFKLYTNVAQHEMLCTSYFWIISLYNFGVIAPEILKFYIDYYQFCSMPDSTPIKPSLQTSQECCSAPYSTHNSKFSVISP